MRSSRFNLVKDLPRYLTLITDGSEIAYIGDAIGAPDLADEFGALFVDVQDGDYGKIYGTSSNVPYEYDRVYDVDKYLNSARYQLENRS